MIGFCFGTTSERQMIRASIGTKRIVRFFRRKTIELGFKYGRLYVLELVPKPDLARSNDYGYQVGIASGLDDLRTLLERREKWFGEEAEQRLGKGDVCFVARFNGDVISCLFATFNSVYLPDVEYDLSLDEDTVGLIDAYTLPEFRGKHVYSLVFDACSGHFSRVGYRKVYGFIAPDNVRSLKVHRKLGLDRIVFDITLVRFLGVRKHFINSDHRLIQEIL